MVRHRHAEIDPHDDPRIVEALSILDALDAKASGLGAILGLIFAANMVLIGALPDAAGAKSLVFVLAMGGLLLQLAALTFAASCLFIMDAKARRLLPSARPDDAEAAIAHFVLVTDRRTRRYIVSLALTFLSVGLLTLAILGYGAIKLGWAH